MSKRVINVVLILLMIVIWALVFNKVFKIYDPESSDQNNPIAVSQAEISFNFSKDTFDLKKIEKDPFLGTIKKVRKRKENIDQDKKKPSAKANTNKEIKKKVNTELDWPKVYYFGHLKGSNSSSKLILIKIDNKLHKVREGELIDNISISKVYRDSVLVRMKGSIKVVKKQR